MNFHFHFLRRVMSGLIGLALVAVLPASAQETAPAVTVLKAARLFDGTRDTTIANGVVVIEGGTIKAVGSGLAVPAGATVIDLGDATLLPGIIDAHVHLTGESGDNWYKDVVDGLRRRCARWSARPSWRSAPSCRA